MVNRQAAADRFAHDIMERMRGVSLTPSAARELKAAIDVRTTASEGPVRDVMDVLRGRQLEEPEAQAILEFIGAITRPPFSVKVSQEDAERFNQRGDYPAGITARKYPRQSEPDARIVARVDFPRGKTISYGPALEPGDPGYIAPPEYRKIRDNPQA